ncbi:hypothetical protein A3194_12450 [Candidatus Thiodiazotropha endoloripes]|uniref:hypothetical protein n=1 Tax=Candidatus Thiodiazotropha endoloripes TaxID=1818881 RepID=UPI00083CE90A|nr:hypothetical protein [Candidatus Thiodiazotropha endoloripes]ODB85638.1 hypothetical protein A3194_12450 [Candidatus Thiodiazotropha endoloripes]
MNGVRMAALYLHGLEESDRDWLLNSLTSNERILINEKLLELSELGIPVGTAWLPEITMDPTNKEEQPTNEQNNHREVEQINDANHDSIFELLDELPVELVVLILNVSIWTWRQAYISTQNKKKRSSIMDGLEKPLVKHKAKVQKALILSLYKQLNSSATDKSNIFDMALESAQNNVNGSIWRKLWRR